MTKPYQTLTPAQEMGTIQLVPGGAKIGIGGVGLFRNKRPYIWIEDGQTVWTLGTLHPRITPKKFWELMERVIGRPIVNATDATTRSAPVQEE